MRLLLVFIFFIALQSRGQNCILSSGELMLRLKDDGQFIFYPKEISLKTNVSGSYYFKNDSLILTTHKMANETAVFAIYRVSNNLYTSIYAQKEFNHGLPNQLYPLKEMYANNQTKHEYIWDDKDSFTFKKYSFNETGGVSCILNFSNNQLEGRQLYYFENNYAALQKELNYKNGALNGKAYYFKQLDKNFQKVQLVKEEKYKNGVLVKTKTPEVQQVFYTSHF